MMFDNYKSTNGDERIAWKTIKRAFCNWNNIEKDIGCSIFVANYVRDYYKSYDACQK
jgi:hypothetical protein